MTKNKYIVTTTINLPTKALLKFRDKSEWRLIVIGDKKTPHDEYRKLDGVTYLDPDEQDVLYPKLSKLLGWNCIQRRNIGYLEALRYGADIIATVDDDNVPYSTWGKKLVVGEKLNMVNYYTKELVFDPLKPFKLQYWHRGYPLSLLGEKHNYYRVKYEPVEVMVEAQLWDGSPDIDAIARIVLDDPEVGFHQIEPYSSNAMMPFNSQNTMLTREALKDFFLFPGIGRMDDIWGSYLFQHKHPNSVAFSEATVKQERNPHDFVKDMRDEWLGYTKTMDLVQELDNIKNYVPKSSYEAYKEYQKICTTFD